MGRSKNLKPTKITKLSRKKTTKTINSPLKKAIAGNVTTSESENEEPVVEPKSQKKNHQAVQRIPYKWYKLCTDWRKIILYLKN